MSSMICEPDPHGPNVQSMPLAEDVRSHCAEIARRARLVSIDLDATAEVHPGQASGFDPDCHFLEGEAEAVASYLLTLTAINFGSGWFPLLEKRTVAGRVDPGAPPSCGR
jgi:hypothetical protein